MVLAAFNFVPPFLSKPLEWELLNNIIKTIASFEQFIIRDSIQHLFDGQFLFNNPDYYNLV
jgi:hypothetical protein